MKEPEASQTDEEQGSDGSIKADDDGGDQIKQIAQIHVPEVGELPVDDRVECFVQVGNPNNNIQARIGHSHYEFADVEKLHEL